MTGTLATAVFVNAREAASIARVHHTRWWGIARKSPVLRRARRKRGNRTYWMTDAVIRWVAENGGTL